MTSTRWYFVQSLPRPRSVLKSTVIENTLYLMGGWDNPKFATKTVYKVDLNQLISTAAKKQVTPILWQMIKDTPLSQSAPLNVCGSLCAVGGYDFADSSLSVHLYKSDTRRWEKLAGDLPTARWDCTCSLLPSGEFIVAGGETNTPLRFCSMVNFKVFFSSP